MNYKLLKDSDLHSKLLNSVQEEKRLLTQVLDLLKEVDIRKLYCDFRCKSLFDYATKRLKYSEAEAYTRINTMRLMKEIPEIEDQLKDGSLSLTNAAQVQSFFKKEEKHLKIKIGKDKNNEKHLANTQSQKFKETLKTQVMTNEKKKTIIAQLNNCSVREAKKILAEASSFKPNNQEFMKPLENGRIELKFSITHEVYEKMKHAKKALKLIDDLNLEDLLEKLCDKALEVEKTCAPRKLRVNKTLTPAMRFYIHSRDKNRCKNCGTSSDLQVDHIKPQALGGTHHWDNLQTLCRSCNMRRAVKTFGVDQIQRVIKLK